MAEHLASRRNEMMPAAMTETFAPPSCAHASRLTAQVENSQSSQLLGRLRDENLQLQIMVDELEAQVRALKAQCRRMRVTNWA